MTLTEINTQHLLNAADQGNTAEVQRLISISDLAFNNEALRRASAHGHVECVKMLIPVSNPKHNDSSALQWASANGYVACVKELIPVSEPKAQNNEALVAAAFYGHHECVDLLFDVCNPEEALEELKMRIRVGTTGRSYHSAYLEQKIYIQRVLEQRTVLEKEVSAQQRPTNPVKHRKI